VGQDRTGEERRGEERRSGERRTSVNIQYEYVIIKQ
jgi:hypothetical protein